ncbi:hypothetical protein SDC9_86948 [bioreactor metagenome]|uniref:Major facilitator superfamily (MFS) profile domain-containing protein n=1 Tax=bioreactor metagenome TaxID=1076179 RepID=A0A644ZJ00_9ZZZZ
MVYYLEAEVVPQKCLGQYLAITCIFGSLFAAAFNYFLLEPAMSHMRLVLGSFAAFYMLAYVLQLLFVKEEQMPPPKKEVDEDSSWFVRTIGYLFMFFRQCFTRKIFIYLALCTGLNAASNVCRSMYIILFATKELTIDLDTVGKITGISAIISAVLIYFFGKLMDRTHPMLIYFLGGLLVMITNVFSYFFLYDTNSFTVISIVTTLVYAFQNLANMPLLVDILPRDKFGQYASGNAMVNHVSLMIGSALGGVVTGWFGYRVMFVWDFVVTGLATLALIGVYFEWKRYGGRNYKAPIVD